jgi:hypothetical protein
METIAPGHGRGRQSRSGALSGRSCGPALSDDEMTTRIWIEPLRHDDGRPRYSRRGQLYRCRLGSADGEVLVEGCLTPALDACRALVARGVTGRFETWREGVIYACIVDAVLKASASAQIAPAEARVSRPHAPSIGESYRYPSNVVPRIQGRCGSWAALPIALTCCASWSSVNTDPIYRRVGVTPV